MCNLFLSVLFLVGGLSLAFYAYSLFTLETPAVGLGIFTTLIAFASFSFSYSPWKEYREFCKAPRPGPH